jgi:hypothetical protein
MKFLCLAYGDEDGWNALSESEQQEVLAQDVVIRDRGNLMSAVQTQVTSVRNWDEYLEVANEPLAQPPLPLAGFSVIEAEVTALFNKLSAGGQVTMPSKKPFGEITLVC